MHRQLTTELVCYCPMCRIAYTYMAVEHIKSVGLAISAIGYVKCSNGILYFFHNEKILL